MAPAHASQAESLAIPRQLASARLEPAPAQQAASDALADLNRLT